MLSRERARHIHTGALETKADAPEPVTSSAQVVEVRVLIKLMAGRESYASKARFIKSRAWRLNSHQCSYQVGALPVLTSAAA